MPHRVSLARSAQAETRAVVPAGAGSPAGGLPPSAAVSGGERLCWRRLLAVLRSALRLEPCDERVQYALGFLAEEVVDEAGIEEVGGVSPDRDEIGARDLARA